MQIIPNTNVFDGAGVFSATDMNSSRGENFMAAMDDAMTSVQDGSNVSVSSALNDTTVGPLVESPYTRHTTDGVTYTLSEVCFSKQELQELRQQLLKEGAPEESLRQFDILVDQPNGATLAQVMASLIGKNGEINISENDEHAIKALLGQIDPSGTLAGDALAFMRGGNSQGALDLIQDALGKFGTADRIDVDVESILALGRGLGLNSNALKGLVAQFGDREEITLNGKQFDNFLNPAKNHIMEAAAQQQKLDAALEKTLKPIIAKARNRMEQEEAASALADRRVAQSKVLIDKTVQENSRQIMDKTVTGENETHNELTKENLLKTLDPQKQIQDGDLNESVQSQLHAKLAEYNFEDGDSGALFEQKDNKSSGWQTLLGKIEVKGNTQTNANPLFAMAEANSLVENGGFANLEAAIPNLPAHVANQVQQGMLTALRDGSTRLDLQLHPAELGTINITLVARNGELTAQIRSEKTETADMVNRQLDTIRVSLEQQGIKVDKLEVQLQDNQDPRNAFLDLGQHNARQETDARRQEMMRFRNLASLRNQGENISDSGLARSVHTSGQTARYGGSALHVIA